ncbi:MAG: Uma2 family endonuclease [Chloroflexi bacterium]|nr:Uma2 family endonuclease [Chloroflexota bacterium]
MTTTERSDPKSAAVTRRRFTVDEYYRMVPAGILREDDRVELIDGEIFQMAPIGAGHGWSVDELTEIFTIGLRGRARVRVQNPVRFLPRSEPQPDIVLLRRVPDRYRGRHPIPEDVSLIVEVADSTLEHNRTVKAPLYATAGIPEMWIVNLKARCVEIYRRPEDGAYRDMIVAGPDGMLSPLAFPDLSIRCADILP